jgi:hypothetical protein
MAFFCGAPSGEGSQPLYPRGAGGIVAKAAQWIYTEAQVFAAVRKRIAAAA